MNAKMQIFRRQELLWALKVENASELPQIQEGDIVTLGSEAFVVQTRTWVISNSTTIILSLQVS